jgi:S1-C subfamily serine protease
MKSFFFACLFTTSLLFTLTSRFSTKADEPDIELHKKCLYPTVRVENEGSGGTGVIVRSDRVGDKEYRNVAITCAHVIHPLSRYKVRVPTYEEWSTFVEFEDYPCRVYGKNEDADLTVLLFTTPRPMPVATFGFRESLYIGTDVYHIGCGLGPEPRLDYGKITSLGSKIEGHSAKAYRTSMNMVPGDSGGPVFHKHRLVGFSQAIKVLCFRGFPTPITHISYIIPVERVKTWDEKENNTLHFIYKERHDLPELPFAILRLEEYRWEGLPK